MKKGRLTIPTDANFVEGTKKYIKKWGADAIRDCDGTELPENAGELAEKVYKTYFVVRSDNDFAYSHDEYMQNVALISERCTALSDCLKIDLMKGLFNEQIRVNPYEYKKYWQVFDRTTGDEILSWDYIGDNIVEIRNAKRMHEYTVNFFGFNLWDATQVYNYTCNNWTIVKDRDMDPIYPEAFERMIDNLDSWLKNNPQISVVRFTTFLYHFFLLYLSGTKQKLVDWYNYPMSASPEMFKLFEKEYGYEIKLEDLITEGYYGNHFLIPTKAVSDYRDLVQRFVAKKMKIIVEKVHNAGKEAMMFWGDNWVGAEPYGKYFSSIKLDAVVGSVQSGASIRAVSDIPNLKYKEIRLMPYFFPDTLNNDETAIGQLMHNWLLERRALMRKPIDRIGFGGYLSLADKLPGFCDQVTSVCDEFRKIYDAVSSGEPYNVLNVAVISYWGKEKSWMTNMISQDLPYPKTAGYIGVIESLSGLPVEVSFLSFDDVKKGSLSDFDVAINLGNANTAFSGGDCWKDSELIETIREYVFAGGGFIGVGEPSAVLYGGRYFQLADILGVDKEIGLSSFYRRNNTALSEHFITRDKIGETDYATEKESHIYALENAEVLDAYIDASVDSGVHIKLSANKYGQGRSVYMSGLRYNSANTRLLFRSLLWCADKEAELFKCFSSNVYTECHYYPAIGEYAVINNTDSMQNTIFYDKNGKSMELAVEKGSICWIKE